MSASMALKVGTVRCSSFKPSGANIGRRNCQPGSVSVTQTGAPLCSSFDRASASMAADVVLPAPWPPKKPTLIGTTGETDFTAAGCGCGLICDCGFSVSAGDAVIAGVLLFPDLEIRSPYPFRSDKSRRSWQPRAVLDSRTLIDSQRSAPTLGADSPLVHVAGLLLGILGYEHAAHAELAADFAVSFPAPLSGSSESSEDHLPKMGRTESAAGSMSVTVAGALHGHG